jgi:hypothetical protein
MGTARGVAGIVVALVVFLIGMVLFQVDGKTIRLPDSNAIIVRDGQMVFVRATDDGVFEAYRCPVEQVKGVMVTDERAI